MLVTPLAENLQQLMAAAGLRARDVAQATGLSTRTVQGILRDESSPHAATIHALATGLGVAVHELFRASPSRADFDRATNPVVDQVIADQPHWFHDWTAADFDELYSRFGAGGPLTYAGAITAAQQMNAKRQHLRRAALVLESDQADLLAGMIDLLYERVSMAPTDEIPLSTPTSSPVPDTPRRMSSRRLNKTPTPIGPRPAS